MVGYIKFLQRRGKITTRYKKLVYFITPVRKARLQVFLLLFAPFGDDWREYCSYPQVPFPSVIPPAVIESWPPSGDRRLFAKPECFIKLLPLQGAGRNAMIPRAMPWATSFCPFRAWGAIEFTSTAASGSPSTPLSPLPLQHPCLLTAYS